jgi:4-aminobutyrate aminotransferase/(S)-3-amino-2-methylpropionate transaminase
VVGKKEIMDSVHPSGIGGTYGGNPVACEAALAVLDIVESENLLDRAKKLGDTLKSFFQQLQEKHEIIGDVRGLGPMIAMELVKDRKSKSPAAEETRALVNYCFENGVIILACGSHGNVLRFLMPLVITEEQLQKGLDIVADGFAAIQQ